MPRFPACGECKCFLQVYVVEPLTDKKYPDGKVACAACGSTNIVSKEIKEKNGRLVLREKCLYCDKEAGKLCSQVVPGKPAPGPSPEKDFVSFT